MFKCKFDRQIARLEKAGNDDFLLILTGGAGAFATHELHHLLRRIDLGCRRLDKLRRLMLRLGLAIPFLLFLAAASSLIAWRGLTGGCLLVIPACLVVLALAQVHVGKRLRTLERAGRLRAIIHQELERRRRGDASLVR